MKFLNKLLCTLALSAMSFAATAAPTFTIGNTVNIVSRTATFEGISGSLVNYAEDNLFVTVDSNGYTGFRAFGDADPRTGNFHYGDGGNVSEVSIRGTDNAVFNAVDFLLGNGYLGQSMYFQFRTYLDGVQTGSGIFEGISAGTVGISDAAGFDELRVAADVRVRQPGFGEFQAIALDDVRAQLIDAVPSEVPEPASILLMGLGLAGAIAVRRRAA